MVDPDFLTNGKLDQAIEVVDTYARELQIEGIRREIVKIEDKPPLIIYVVDPTEGSTKNLMIYGHLDK